MQGDFGTVTYLIKLDVIYENTTVYVQDRNNITQDKTTICTSKQQLIRVVFVNKTNQTVQNFYPKTTSRLISHTMACNVRLLFQHGIQHWSLATVVVLICGNWQNHDRFRSTTLKYFVFTLQYNFLSSLFFFSFRVFMVNIYRVTQTSNKKYHLQIPYFPLEAPTRRPYVIRT